MKLNDFFFVWLDFETTWLDFEKDLPIQIWIIKYNNKFEEIDKFETLINPWIKINDFSEIVSFLTKINKDEIEKAPTINEIKNKVNSFFDKKTIVIWHNINFDIFFLKKFFDIDIDKKIDTYIRTQNLIHYAPSYSLEILINYLSEKKEFINFIKKHQIKFDNKKNHNALYDAKSSIIIFFYLCSYIDNLIKNYNEIKFFLSKKWTIFNDIFFIKEKYIWDIKLKPLKKLEFNKVKLQHNEKINLENFDAKKTYYIWNLNIKKFIEWILINKKIVFSFDNNKKLDIVKNILNQMWIKNIGFAKTDQKINYNKLNFFLKNKNLTEEECFFAIKYISHLYQWYGVFDIKTKTDQRIFYLIQEKSDYKKNDIILTSHFGLFSMLEKEKMEEYYIVFMDIKNRYKSFNNYLSSKLDFFLIINFLEKILYSYEIKKNYKIEYIEIHENLESFFKSFQILVWTIFIISEKLFEWIKDNKLIQNPINSNKNFEKIKILRDNLKKTYNKIKTKLDKEDKKNIDFFIDKIEKIFSEIIIINKTNDNNWNIYFTYQIDVQFTNRQEFKDFFPTKTYYFSTSNKEYEFLYENKKEEKKYNPQKINNLNTIYSLLDENLDYKWNKTIIIFCLNKNSAKKIFQKLYNFDKINSLVVEWITWWQWKSIFQTKNYIKTNWNKIFVWWYNFLLNILNNNINVDILIEFNIYWNNWKTMLDEIFWYTNR